ncbi:MAG: Tat pathway signal protein, partial [Lachnospiraceae bacterium]|nr:Tat pathway signal protein [Lachnospiraceae bacterium]
MKQRTLTGLAVFALAAAVLSGIGNIESRADVVPAVAKETGTAEPVKPAPAEFAHITSCAIGGDGQIAVDGVMEGSWSDPAFYDNYLYLFELKPYEDDLTGRSDYIGWITKGDALSFRVPLNLGTEEDRLYSKFVVAVFDGEQYTQVSNTAYVTNPEAVAKNRDAYRTAQNKKGLLIETTPGMVADAFELGVNHVNVNIPFNRLLGSGIDYTYDGKTYHFNKDLVSTYDTVIRRMSEKSMTVTA